MIVLNEIKYAEDIIRTGKIDKKPSITIGLLSKYYTQQVGLSFEETIEEINKFMDNNYAFYNKVKWADSIIKIVKKSSKYNLRNIECINITQKEIETIRKLNNDRIERLLFTMLCLAKTYNATSEINNGWINTDVNDVYRCARVTTRSSRDKNHIIYELIQGGYLECSKKNTNLNLRVTFVDNESPVVMAITNLEELGYEYINYTSSKKYRFCRCRTCNRLIKVKKNENRFYCNDHSQNDVLETKIIACIDCGKQVIIDNKNTKTCRCEECQHEETNKQVRENMKKYRDKSKCYNSNEKANIDFS